MLLPMRITYFIVVALCALQTSGQSLLLKHATDDRARKNLTFEINDLSGTLSATANEINLTLKNSSSQAITFNPTDYILKSVRGTGVRLCSTPVIIAPKKKATITLNRCEDGDRLGLFGLDPTYNSKEEFKSSALFLIDQEFHLMFGPYSLVFYTSI